MPGPVQIPHFSIVAHGDSLCSIALNDETKAVALGEQNLLAPLAAMAVLTTKQWTQAVAANGSDHNLSFQQLATLANCTVAGLAAANATAPIIAKGVTLVVRGKPYTTPQVATLNDVAAQFAATYFFSGVNAAEIATSNADVLAVDPTVTSVLVTDHVVHPGDTFASLGGNPNIGPAHDLIQSNIATRSIYASGTPLLIDVTSAPTDATDLATFLDEHQITAAQFGSFNAPSALVPGAQLDVPDLATMPTDAYGAYSHAGGPAARRRHGGARGQCS